ncbi:UNVERIFIED_CONTAM: DENN domain and WD repeat-containing protein SCD1 [Sesamum angustifolium]|uniref:DENN domain and WD repeat-containing protein SCD1 n=1 Tax=Sesamum angustifolium TaxID=2727405 RepID=A0AAW2IWW2_9LAMI
MARIFEYFVVCGIGPEIRTLDGNRGYHGTGIMYLPSLLDQYPSSNHSLYPPPPPQLPTCVLPAGVQFYASGFDSGDSSSFPRSYPIVLTEGDGSKIYVSCIAFRDPVCEDIAEAYRIPANSFADKCICLISRAPSFSILRDALEEIFLLCFSTSGSRALGRFDQRSFRQSFPLALGKENSLNWMSIVFLWYVNGGQVLLNYSISHSGNQATMGCYSISSLQCTFAYSWKDRVLFAIENSLLAVEVPPKGGLPHADISFQPLQCLDVDNFIKLFTAVLLERRICFAQTSPVLFMDWFENITSSLLRVTPYRTLPSKSSTRTTVLTEKRKKTLGSGCRCNFFREIHLRIYVFDPTVHNCQKLPTVFSFNSCVGGHMPFDISISVAGMSSSVRHVYIPLLFFSGVDYIDAPTPYMMGLHSGVDIFWSGHGRCELYLIKRNKVVVVDLEHNLITTSEEIPKIPEPENSSLRGEIMKLLYPNVVGIDQMKSGSFSGECPGGGGRPWGEDHDLHLRFIFLKFFASILGGYRNFIENTATHIFNSQAFLKKRSRSTNQPPDPMISQFLDSQGFLDYLERGLGSEGNGNNLLDKLQDAIGRGQNPLSILPAMLTEPEIITISDPGLGMSGSGAKYCYDRFPANIRTEEQEEKRKQILAAASGALEYSGKHTLSSPSMRASKDSKPESLSPRERGCEYHAERERMVLDIKVKLQGLWLRLLKLGATDDPLSSFEYGTILALIESDAEGIGGSGFVECIREHIHSGWTCQLTEEQFIAVKELDGNGLDLDPPPRGGFSCIKWPWGRSGSYRFGTGSGST